MAAKAGSFHLMFSMDQKLDQKGGARPLPHQHHPMPLGPSFSINCTPAAKSLPEAYKQSHKKMLNSELRLYLHICTSDMHLIILTKTELKHAQLKQHMILLGVA